MVFLVHDTVRERARVVLAAADRPLTAAGIADQLNTTPAQIRRGLRQLEAEGAAVRERGHSYVGGIGWAADLWISR